MTAQNYENLLQVCLILVNGQITHKQGYQCAIPVFEGLLPEPHNTRILQLLFIFAHWHGLAKLRLHNDLTLCTLNSVTNLLGRSLRDFRTKTCLKFQTRELKREVEARIRHEARMRMPNDMLPSTIEHVAATEPAQASVPSVPNQTLNKTAGPSNAHVRR